MKGRNTTIISTRIHDIVAAKLKKQATKQNMTISEWIKKLIEQNLRY